MIGFALAIAATSSCTRTVTEYKVIDTACYSFRPLILTDEDVDKISDQLADQVLAHNRTGAALCSWKRGQ